MGVLTQLLTPPPLPPHSKNRNGGGNGERRGGTYIEQALEGMLAQAESGVAMSEGTALGLAAVYACVTVLSQDVAGLPLITYERMSERRKRRATEHPLYELLHNAPNPAMTSYKWRETMMGHLATWGNAYSEIVYDGAGRVVALWPLRPDKMRGVRLEGGVVWYDYELPEKSGGKVISLPAQDILHIKGLGGNGLVGYTLFELHRNAMGLAKATETFGSKLFKNGAMPKVVLRHPGKLSDNAMKNLKTSFLTEHQGLEAAHRTAILEEGMDISTIGIPPEDAQFLETRRFQLNEVARIYRVAPFMVGDLERATFSNVEQLSINHVIYTLRPWLVNWEQEIWLKLLLPGERERYFVEFLVDGLLRGDITSRYTAYNTARNGGWLSANDIRELENMDKIPGGDVYWMPMNMVPAGSETPALSTTPAQNSSPDTQGRKNEIASPPTAARNDREEERKAEERAVNFGGMRHRLEGIYRPLYFETARRILRKESNDVGTAVRKLVKGEGMGALTLWMETYYREHAERVKEQMMPLGRSYGMQVADLAAQEVEQDTPEENVGKFTESYVGGYAARHVGISQSKIEQRYVKAVNDEEDPEEALLDELESWPEQRSRSIALEEAVRFGNAMAKTVYGIAGVTVLRLVSFGENCPYCDSQDGRVIGIEENFISAGGSLEVEGHPPLTSTTDIAHPPLHNGCDCAVMAG